VFIFGSYNRIKVKIDHIVAGTVYFNIGSERSFCPDVGNIGKKYSKCEKKS
jgi:hypothetical protein